MNKTSTFSLCFFLCVISTTGLSANGIEFEPDVRVDFGSGLHSSAISRRGVCVNGDTVFVCGVGSVGNGISIYISISTDRGMNFGDLKAITYTNAEGEPQFVVENPGTIHVTYTKTNWSPLFDNIAFVKSIDLGETYTPAIIVSDTTEYFRKSSSIDIDSSGNVYIAWQEWGTDFSYIFFTRSLNGGETFESNYKVSNNYTDGETNPCIAVDRNNGNIYLAWIRSGRVYCAKSIDGGASFWNEILAVSGFNAAGPPSIRVNNNGEIGIVVVTNNTMPAIHFVKSTDHGQSFSAPVRVDENPSNSYFLNYPKLFMEGNHVYVIWYEARKIEGINYNYLIPFSLSTDGGDSFEPPVLVSDSTFSRNIPKYPGGICVSDLGYIYAVWNDCREDTIFCERNHVYCSRASEAVGIVSQDQLSGYPLAFSLYQNYPNPFNPVTTISFSVPDDTDKKHRVNLSIYNVRGNLVNMLVSQEMAPGNYKIVWDGRNSGGQRVPSGIYFYFLKTEDVNIKKKLILLR